MVFDLGVRRNFFWLLFGKGGEGEERLGGKGKGEIGHRSVKEDGGVWFSKGEG